MNQNTETPGPTAAHYRALIDRFNEAARAHASGEIDFPAFRGLIAQIDQESRSLNLLRTLNRTLRTVLRQEQKQSKAPLTP